MMENALRLVENYKNAVANLEAYRVKNFKSGAFVEVNCDRYRGFGFVVVDYGAPPHVIPVKLQNGNTWWYPMEAVSLVKDIKSVPNSIRKSKLKHYGYKLTGCAVKTRRRSFSLT